MMVTWATPTAVGCRTRNVVSCVMVNTKTRSKNSSSVVTGSSGRLAGGLATASEPSRRTLAIRRRAPLHAKLTGIADRARTSNRDGRVALWPSRHPRGPAGARPRRPVNTEEKYGLHDHRRLGPAARDASRGRRHWVVGGGGVPLTAPS